MICKACRKGNHSSCTGGDCDCPDLLEEKQIKQSMTASRQSDAAFAETVYSTLLHGGSDVARMLTDGAGRDNVQLFVQQILRTYKAVQC